MSLTTEIAAIEAILNDGARAVSTDGRSVQDELPALRRRLEELRRKQDATKRPRVAGIDLSNAW